MALCLCGEVSFPVRVGAAENKTKAETEAVQVLFNGQRMQKWNLSSKIIFLTRDNQIKIFKTRLVRLLCIGFLGKGSVLPGTLVPLLLPLYGPLASGLVVD